MGSPATDNVVPLPVTEILADRVARIGAELVQLERQAIAPTQEADDGDASIGLGVIAGRSYAATLNPDLDL